MPILNIVYQPADVLRKPAKPVMRVSAAMRKLLDDMAETMYEAPGVGLAGPQVGVAKRIVVIDPQDETTGLLQLINPEIVHTEGWVQGTEGCLSIPGKVGEVYRYERVKVVALDRNGHKVYFDASGFLARVFQHEIDHLDGILYTDKCTNLREAKPGDDEDEEVGEELDAAEGE
jgi:peptide deformylase